MIALSKAYLEQQRQQVQVRRRRHEYALKEIDACLQHIDDCEDQNESGYEGWLTEGEQWHNE